MKAGVQTISSDAFVEIRFSEGGVWVDFTDVNTRPFDVYKGTRISDIIVVARLSKTCAKTSL